MRGEAEVGGRDSTGAETALGRTGPKAEGKSVLGQSSTPGAEQPQGPAREAGIAGEWQRLSRPGTCGTPGTPARPHHVAAARHVLSLGPAPPPNQRAGAELPPSHWLTPSPPGRAVQPPRSPPAARPWGCNAPSGWLIAERRRLAQRLEGRGLRLVGRWGAHGDWPGRGRWGRCLSRG